jgi:hypothetical protein
MRYGTFRVLFDFGQNLHMDLDSFADVQRIKPSAIGKRGCNKQTVEAQ